MSLLEGINYPAVAVSVVVYYFIGFIWYSLLFGKIWANETGVVLPDKSGPRVLPLVGQFVSTFLYVLGIAFILKLHGPYGIREAIHVSAMFTIFIIIPMNSGNLFFTGKKKLFAIDVCELAIGTFVIGIILGLWN